LRLQSANGAKKRTAFHNINQILFMPNYVLREFTTGEYLGTFTKIISAQTAGSSFSHIIERFET
jgi:hypothetical protein